MTQPWDSLPELAALLEFLRTGVQATLGDQLLGLYIGGSLAAGDFHNGSDIDFLGITRSRLSPGMLGELAELHDRIFDQGEIWYDELEGSYIPLDAINLVGSVPGEQQRHPRIERGDNELLVVPHDSDWVIHRHVFREHGIALLGPPVSTYIEPVTAAQLQESVVRLYREWWEPMLTSRGKLKSPAYRRYAVHTMGRMLYTLETGAVTSKPAAAQWALEWLPPELQAVVAGTQPTVGWQPTVRDTAALIRFVGTLCGEAAER